MDRAWVRMLGESRRLKNVHAEGDRAPLSIGSVAATLAGVAGGVDAVGYLALFHLFVAHMSGNSVGFAASLARGEWREAAIRGLPVPFFVLGIVIGAFAAELAARSRRPRALARALSWELAAVATVMVTGIVYAPSGSVGAPLGWRFCMIAALAAFTMGLQNGMVRRLDRRSRATTYVSGLLTLIGESITSRLLARGRRGERARTDPTLRYTAVYAAYIVGAGVSSVLYEAAAFAALVIPMSGLMALIIRDVLTPPTNTATT